MRLLLALACLLALPETMLADEKPESPIVVDGVKVVWDAKQNHYIEEATGGRVMFFEFVGGDGKTIRKALGRERKLSDKDQQQNAERLLDRLLPLHIHQTLFIDHGDHRTFESLTKDGRFRINTQFDLKRKDGEPWVWSVYKRTTDGAGYRLQNRGSELTYTLMRERVKGEIENSARAR